MGDFPSLPLCPPIDATGPAHLASSLDGVFPEVGSRMGIKVSGIKLWDTMTRGKGGPDLAFLSNAVVFFFFFKELWVLFVCLF